MAFQSKILADSVSPVNVRLTTLEITFPRIVLSEFNTHRVFSRNSSSSRAIPVEKMIKMVLEDPYIPSHWGQNQKGMQANQELPDHLQIRAKSEWLKARDKAVESASLILDIGVHKQITNRLLEPFMWHTVIVSSTEWDNFFNLRCHPDAHPEINKIASMMRNTLYNNKPTKVDYGEWHLPLVPDIQEISEEFSDKEALLNYLKKVSTGRCARVSYLTHDNKRDLNKDIELHNMLLKSGHFSPFEHIARPLDFSEVNGDIFPGDHFVGNFRGWVQYRKEIPSENNIIPANH